MNPLCARIEERLADAIDGTLDDELSAHLRSCDACRACVDDAAFVVESLRHAGGDHAPPRDLEERIVAAIEARTRVAPAREPRRLVPSPRVALTALALAAAATIALVSLRHRRTVPASTAAAPWRGVVTKAAGPEGGLLLIEGGKARPLRAGEAFAAGAVLRTDARTRARLTLDDGTHVIVDRGAELSFDAASSRTLRLARGAAVLDVTSSEGVPATVHAPGGTLTSRGGKLSVAAISPSNSAVAVARGTAALNGTTLLAGEGATFATSEVRAAGLASAFAWSSEIDEPKANETGGDVPGLGVLRARVPGANGDGDKALRLVRQKVSVRIAGDLARTEVDETFASDDPQVLEGIFRFPLPPDAQIERLALEVDGKLEEGAFVDKDKGAAIWKGVLSHAAPRPNAPKPQEEWIWVPGPWNDPALLEWRAGGRMELKIFPIPAKGSRRVVLAYTQRVARVAGARRYVYPLPHFGATSSAIEDFTLDLQVVGHDASRGVNVRGYELDAARTLHKTGFVPSGDFVVEYARKDEAAHATAWAYRAPGGSEPAFVALSFAPKLPRLPDNASRTHVIVVDSSRSMYGERWARASSLATRIVEEMDPGDRFALLACDVSCVPFDVAPKPPGKTSAAAVKTFLSSVVPEGASDPVAAVKVAVALSKSGEAGRSLRVLYLGDGAPTVGARTPAAIEAGVRAAIGEASLNAVAVGVDADLASLDAMARGGGGVVLPYVAGQPLSSAALDALEASYGAMLRDPILTLPKGLDAVAPTRLAAVRSGGELLVTARMAGSRAAGEAKLEGTVAGKPWSATFPLVVEVSEDAGNAFVPRLWAASTVADLERRPGAPEREKIVELSKTWSVPSRFTSLIVLESPAMAAAFGVAPIKKTYPEWTGDVAAVSTTSAEASPLAMGDAPGLGMAGIGFGGGGTKGAPAATAAPKAEMPKPSSDAEKSVKKKGPGTWMRREWYRTVSIVAATGPEPDLESKIAAANLAVTAAPDSRDKLEALFGLVAKRDLLDEAHRVMNAWVARDPLDLPATLRRSELAAREADRARALRVLTGALEGRPDDASLADGIAEVASRAGNDALACALYGVRVDVKPSDLAGLARRVGCLRALGEDASSLIEGLDATKKSAVEALVGAKKLPRPSVVHGDLSLEAMWSASIAAAPVDVDLALVDPKGVRHSFLSPSGVRAADVLSTSHESLAVPWAGAGGWTVELTRAAASSTPVSGTVTVRLLGESRTFPFMLTGARTVVARVQIGWASRLVPAGWSD